ncbi:MAG: zf-HC2 domain-containing protein [Nitrospinota bacterium]|nr:zf-HC2 domain-containing protein [Nitrospinota bacterium]
MKADNDNGCKGHTHENGECIELLGKMSDYVDEELDPGTQARLESHFQNCPPCLMVLQSLRKTLEIFRRRDDIIPPENLSGEIREKIGG